MTSRFEIFEKLNPFLNAYMLHEVLKPAEFQSVCIYFIIMIQRRENKKAIIRAQLFKTNDIVS